MERLVIETNRELKKFKLLSSGRKSIVYDMGDGNILKIFNPLLLMQMKMFGEDKEKKIWRAKPLEEVPEILVPTHTVYDVNSAFLGYKMPTANGIDYVTYEHSVSKEQASDLMRYATEYKRVESMVKRAHKYGIIIPDLLTCENMYIGDNGNLQMIDYDGLQIEDQISVVLSSALGDQKSHSVPKYFDKSTNLYKEDLDIKSLVYFYFLHVFNIKLAAIGQKIPGTNERVNLDMIFSKINMDDYDFMNKVWKCTQSTGNNEYLGDDVFRIAEDYKLVAERIPGTYMYIKELRKK